MTSADQIKDIVQRAIQSRPPHKRAIYREFLLEDVISDERAKEIAALDSAASLDALVELLTAFEEQHERS